MRISARDSRPFNPLLENFPPVILGSRVRDGEMTWLGERSVRKPRNCETRVQVGRTCLAGLPELMFIEVVRQYVAASLPGTGGLFAGLRDPLAGKALSLMHSCPA